MSNPDRKRYYREVLRYTRRRPRRRVAVVRGVSPATLMTLGGMTLAVSRWTLTLASRPGAARRPPPVLAPDGSYTETWEA